MREIGGYFELEHFFGKEYHPDALSFNTAKSALVWLIGKREIRRLWMPEYLCTSVTRAVGETGRCEIRWYGTGDDLQPKLPLGEIAPRDAVYLVNYYGQLPMSIVETLRERVSQLILDNVQAFFEKPLPGVDTIYSCRKWFGVPDGAYLYAEGLQQEELPPWRVVDRFTHLLGRFETSASAWYETYRASEAALDESPVCGMSALAKNILRGVDYERVRKRRTENFSFLQEQLGEKNQLRLRVPDGAFMYPFWARGAGAEEARQRLIENGVYVPLLWPGLQGRAAEMARQILPLPVDQRYTEKEMSRVVELLNG